MAESADFIIRYTADFESLKRELANFSRIQANVAQQLGTEFANGLKIVDQQLANISRRKIRIPLEAGGFKEVIATFGTFNTTVETADGKVLKLSETFRKADGETVVLNSKITQLKKQLETIVPPATLGQLDKFVTELKKVENIRRRIAAQGNTSPISSIGATSLASTKQQTSIIDGKKVTQEVQTFTTQVKLANGSMKTLTDTVRSTNGAVNSMGSTFKTAATGTLSFQQNLFNLAKRAALTIPIWLGLRSAILAIPAGMAKGVKDLVEFDKALQKIKFNLTGFSSNPAAAIDEIREKITQLSLATGASTEDIAKAFERFVSAGFDTQTAFAGAEGAIRNSIALFGDAGEAANTFAAAFKVLVDESENAIPPQEQIASLFAQVTELAKTNVFTLAEFTESLDKFSGTAKRMNFTSQQTVALLATLNSAAIKGSRGGTILRSAFNKLQVNLDKIDKVLGLKVNPQLESTFDIFLKVVGAIEELNKADPRAATEALGQLFELRGTEAVGSLSTVTRFLKENIAVTGDITKLRKETDDLNKSLSGQVKLLGNLAKESGKGFITGLVGAENFSEALKTVNSNLESIRAIAPAIGKALRVAFGVQQLGFGNTQILSDSFNEDIQSLASAAPKAFDQISGDIVNRFNKGLKDGFSKSELDNLLTEITTFGPELLQIDEGLFNVIVERLKSEEAILAIKKEQAQATEEQFISESNRRSIAETILDLELQRLRFSGASEGQLSKAELSLRKQFDIEKQGLELLKQKLESEQKINQERRLQNSLGSDSIKLFNIAKEQGTQTAKAIADVLAGDTSFDTFVRRGGKQLEVFKKQFGDIFEQQQGQQFFRGETVSGLPSLRGGAGVNIQEQSLQTPITSFDSQASLDLSKALSQFLSIQAAQNARATPPVANITQNINVVSDDPEEAANNIAEEMNKPGSNIRNATTDVARQVFNEE